MSENEAPKRPAHIFTQEYHQSRKAFVKRYAIGGVVVGLAIPAAWLGAIPATIAAVTGIGVMLHAERKRKWHSVEVAMNKVSVHSGFLTRHSYGIYYDDIVDIKVKQTLWQRMMGYGSIYVNNPGRDHRQFCAHNMPKPHKIAKHIERMERHYTSIRHLHDEFE